MAKMNKRRLGDILQSYGAEEYDDSSYYLVLDADKDFKHEVLLMFALDDSDSADRIMISGSCSDLTISSAEKAADALLLCNKWNEEGLWGTAYLNTNDKELRVRMSLSIENDVSDAYLNDFIESGIGVVWDFYKEAGKLF